MRYYIRVPYFRKPPSIGQTDATWPFLFTMYARGNQCLNHLPGFDGALGEGPTAHGLETTTPSRSASQPKRKEAFMQIAVACAVFFLIVAVVVGGGGCGGGSGGHPQTQINAINPRF